TGGFIVVILGLTYLTSILLRVSLVDLGKLIVKRISDDWQEWRRTRDLVKK
ncbi:unnamed protein product, partial [marine sediment metagenome]